MNDSDGAAGADNDKDFLAEVREKFERAAEREEGLGDAAVLQPRPPGQRDAVAGLEIGRLTLRAPTTHKAEMAAYDAEKKRLAQIAIMDEAQARVKAASNIQPRTPWPTSPPPQKTTNPCRKPARSSRCRSCRILGRSLPRCRPTG